MLFFWRGQTRTNHIVPLRPETRRTEPIGLLTTGGEFWGEHFVLSDTKNEWCYGVTVNIRSDMFMILQGEISKRSSNLNCRREAILQRDTFSIYEMMMCKRGNGRARCGSFCLRHVARVLVSGTVFFGQMAWIRDLGKGARAMTCLKTVPILRQGKVNVKVIYLLEVREERDRLWWGII